MSLTPEQIQAVRAAAGASPTPSSAAPSVSLSQKIGVSPPAPQRSLGQDALGLAEKGFNMVMHPLDSLIQPVAEKVATGIQQDFQERNKNVAQSKADVNSGKQSLASGLYQSVGQAAGLAGDALYAEPLKAILPQPVKDVAKTGLADVLQTPQAQQLIQAWKGFEQAHPELASNIKATGNIASILPVGAVEGVGAKGVSLAAKLGEKTAAIARPVDALAENAAKKSFEDVNKLTGAIVQGKTSDIAKAKKALTDIDISGVKSYGDLQKALDTKITSLSATLDRTLEQNTVPAKLDQLSSTIKVGDAEIKHNYVEDALNQLKELYEKTNDPAGVEKVAQLRAKAQDTGLTIKEINDLARIHGSEFSSKAFSRAGEPLTSVNAQSLENTRTGLKEKARELFGNPTFKEADSQLSSLIRTRDLTQKMNENVNKLKQKIKERNLGEKVGYLVGNLLNTFSGGLLKGAVQSVIPRGQGFKVLNALDLEKALNKNLKKVQNILDKNLPEKDVEAQLKEMLGEAPEVDVGAKASIPSTTKLPLTKGATINPAYEPKIHIDDLREMKDFTDYVGGDYKPDPKLAQELELSATRMWEKYLPNKTLPKTLKGIANEFGRLVEKNQAKLDADAKKVMPQPRDTNSQQFLPKS